jgi:hypothetical protein
MNVTLISIIILLSFSLLYVILNKKIEDNIDKLKTQKPIILSSSKEEPSQNLKIEKVPQNLKIEKIVYIPPKSNEIISNKNNYSTLSTYPTYPKIYNQGCQPCQGIQSYYPQSLLYPRNVYLDYVLNGYQPSHGYTWDKYYGWFDKRNERNERREIINNIHNNISIPNK